MQLSSCLAEGASLCDVKVLEDLFINGKIEFVMKVLIQLNTAIEEHYKDLELVRGSTAKGRATEADNRVQVGPGKNKKLQISSLVNMSIAKLLSEINSSVQRQEAQELESKAPPAKSKPK